MVKRSEVKSLMERKVEEFLRRADLEITSSNSSGEDYYGSICDEEDGTGDHHRIHRSTKSKSAQFVYVWL